MKVHACWLIHIPRKYFSRVVITVRVPVVDEHRSPSLVLAMTNYPKWPQNTYQLIPKLYKKIHTITKLDYYSENSND